MKDHLSIHLEGRKRLRRLLPWARGEARKMYDCVEAETSLAVVQFQYITEANLEALVVYPSELGGWHADVVLKAAPPGVANSLGTPEQSPVRTRQEAEDKARSLLCMAMFIAKRNLEQAEQRRAELPPTFLLMGHSMELIPEIYAKVARLMPDMMMGWETPEESAERIRIALEHCPGAFTPAAFELWDHKVQATLMGAVHFAALNGLHRYPPIAHRSPSGHNAEASSARH